jgi:hypothetical protein
MRPLRAPLWMCFVFLSLSSGAACLVLMVLDTQPLPAVAATSQRVEANPKNARVRAVYKVKNRGGGDLVFGEALTSCGCSVASIRPAVLKPGRTAVITVDGTAPAAGEKTVKISIGTNSKRKPLIELSLTMVGRAEVPFVASSSNVVQFGTVHEGNMEQPFFLVTHEDAAKGNWVRKVMTASKGIEILTGPSSEHDIGGGIVARRYEYTAKLGALPEPGVFSGEVLWFADSSGGVPILRIPLQGTVRVPVFSSPAVIYGVFDLTDEYPKLSFSLAPNDPTFALDAKFIRDASTTVTVRETSRYRNRILYEVSPIEPLTKPLVSTLTFETNHPKPPTVRIPLHLVVTNK